MLPGMQTGFPRKPLRNKPTNVMIAITTSPAIIRIMSIFHHTVFASSAKIPHPCISCDPLGAMGSCPETISRHRGNRIAVVPARFGASLDAAELYCANVVFIVGLKRLRGILH